MKNTLSPLLLLLACALPLSAGDAPADTTPPVPPTPPVTAPDGKLLLEFRGARLGQVLDHLSKEAGFIIANPIELAAPITLVAKQPLTPLEAVDALNSVLIDLGHVAIVRGKSLHVVTLPTARQQSLPVMVGADPAKIPDTDRMVTQVMPVQHATAKDLAENLQPLLNAASATLSANESSNVLILTDTQAHVRRIAAIIQAIDQSISGEQQVKVFHLAHADAEKVATIINNLYGNKQSSANNQQNRNNPFAGFNPFGGGNQGGGGRGGGGSGNNNNANAASGGSRGVDVVAAADSGTNSLVIKASADALEALGEVIKELDVDNSARDGVLLYRVLNGKAADLATALNNLFQGSQGTTGAASTTQRTTTQNRTVQGGAAATRAATPAAPAAAGGAAAGSGDSSLDLTGQVRVVADPTSNSVMILSPERNFERLKRLLIDLDQPLRQVLVRVLVAEVTLEKGLDLGVELDGVNPRGNTADSRVFSNFNIFDSTLGMNGYLLQTADFHATIRALASTTRFDVLSRPYILTTDTHEATVNVSQEVPIINGSRTDQNNNVTTTFDRRDVGIILTVTPQINSEGRVVLDVTQELSALADQTIPVGVGVQSPIINKRTMTTRVVVEHGQTAVVGGLVKDQLSETVRKIPLLGDIPVLGALFRRTISTKTQTELLVFLTPQVVQNPNDLADLARQLRGEMQRLDAAVEKDVLQHHLDQLNNLKLGQPLAPPVNSGKTKP